MSARGVHAVRVHPAQDADGHPVGRLRWEQVPDPVPGPGAAVVGIRYGGICGSDLHYRSHGAAGASVLREPMVLGHEVVGVVEQAAADGSGPGRGTAVVVHPATPCGSCPMCRAGRANLCPSTSYLGSAAHLPHTDGGFTERMVVPTARLLPVPPGTNLEVAALTEPASVAWHAVGRAGGVRGQRVLVVGAGPIGALVVAVLHRAGAAEIVVTDVHERARTAARALGAHRDLAAASAELVDLEVDVAIESSGSVPGVADAVAGLRRGGRLVLLGLLPQGPQPFPVARVTAREIDVAGSFRFHTEMPAVLDALADGSLPTTGVVSHIRPVEDARSAFDLAADPAVSGKVLLRFAPAPGTE